MIRRRLMLIAAPLCAVVVAASVAFAATPDTEHSSDAKLDKLHQVRPDAATDLSADDTSPAAVKLRNRFVVALQRGLDADQFSFIVGLRLAQDQEFTDLVNAAVDAFIETLTPPPPTYYRQSGYSGYASSAPVSSGSSGGSPDALACIRAHESDSAGGYQAVSSGGTYRGAYQFVQGTWDNTAAAAGRSDLVGADPATVAPADQDAMASSLYSTAGSSPWGGRC
jgi:hypothetical protein